MDEDKGLRERAPEIVSALKIHADAGDQCGGCCYDDGKSLDCGARLTADAAGVIEQLSAQLAALQAENAELRTTLSRVEAARDAYRALGTVEELARGGALVKARDEGRLPKLPCRVGEIVYYILPDCNEYFGYFVSEPHRVTEVGTRGFWTSAIPDDEPDAMSDFTPWSDFGKTVFLTRAEAEAVQREEGQDDPAEDRGDAR